MIFKPRVEGQRQYVTKQIFHCSHFQVGIVWEHLKNVNKFVTMGLNGLKRSDGKTKLAVRIDFRPKWPWNRREKAVINYIILSYRFEGLFLVLILTKTNNKGVSKWRPKRLPPCQPIIESCDDDVPSHTELRNRFLFGYHWSRTVSEDLDRKMGYMAHTIWVITYDGSLFRLLNESKNEACELSNDCQPR